MLLKRLAAMLLALVLILALAACGSKEEEAPGPEEETGTEEELADYPVQIGAHMVRARPGTVVSLSASLTEKLCDMGMEDRLVGISEFCDYPESVTSLPRCGTALLPELSVIESLEPHLVLVQTDLPEDVVVAFQEMDVDVAVIPQAGSVAEYKESYVSLYRALEGDVTGGMQGQAYALNLQDRLDWLEDLTRPYAGESGGKPALYLRLLDFNVATGDTLEGELMELVGLRNIAQDQRGWLYDEEEATGDEGRGAFQTVEILYMDESISIKDLEQHDYYKGLPCVLQDLYLNVDCTAFERQGERMLDILEEMVAAAYPGAIPDGPGSGEDEEEAPEPEAQPPAAEQPPAEQPAPQPPAETSAADEPISEESLPDLGLELEDEESFGLEDDLDSPFDDDDLDIWFGDDLDA